MPEANRRQALVPEGARLLDNPIGTAPGLHGRLGRTHLFALPGVPSEMMRLFEDFVVPVLDSGGAVLLSRRVHTFGISESQVAATLQGLVESDQCCSLGTTVSGGVVSVCLSGRWDRSETGGEVLDRLEQEVRRRLGAVCFGRDDQRLDQIVGRMLLDRGQTLATAESCTGGWLGKLLTDEPGASAYYLGGWVVYTDAMKQSQLNVEPELLTEHGAVSEPVVRALAEQATKTAGADHGLAISGIAGPDGGRPDKPVGTVWIGRGSVHGPSEARRFLFHGDRREIRIKSAHTALNMLREHLLEKRL